MAKRSSSLFSPTRHHALRRRSVTSSGGGGSAMSPSSNAPWSRKENALLVQAWRDVAEHPCAALESVDAFQTRLFLRFQEVCSIGKDNDDDTVSMAGSECSMESVDAAGDGFYARASRTQTSVVLKTYALRRMAGFIADFVAKQEMLKQKMAEKQESVETSQDGEEVEMIEEEEESAPVDWFALSKNDQIERFQRVGASNYIELDEHAYRTIETILELQEKCKQEAVAHGSGNSNSSNTVNAAASSQNAWSEEEVRHVLDAWRDSHLRTPTKLPGGDSFYARFIARSGHNSQRSKPEVADTKIALMNMHQVIATFHNRTPTNGKLTRGNLKRQRQNWFTLSAAVKKKVFAEGGGNQGCRFVDISEDMYETISDLVGPPSTVLTSSFSSSSSSSGGGGGGDMTPEPSKRRSISTKVGTSNASPAHSIKSETIDLISDDDSSIEDEDNEDEDGDDKKKGDEEEDKSVKAVPTPSQAGEEHGDDIDMEQKESGSSANAAALAETTPAGLQSDDDAEEDLNPDDGGDDEDLNPDGDAGADPDVDDASSDENMDCDEELKEPTPVATENGNEQHSEVSEGGKYAELGSVEQNGGDDKRTASNVHDDETEHDSESPRTSARKKQKLEHPEVTAMMNQLERQTQHLNELVLQVQEERDREREEREKLLRAIKVDQHGREAVLELLRIEQEERRQDREERRNVLQILLRETQQRRKEFGAGGGVKSESMAVKIKDENARL